MIFIITHILYKDYVGISTIFKIVVQHLAPDKYEDVENRSLFITVVHFFAQGKNEDVENSSFPKGELR